jgi:hypothetical protein
MAVLLLSAAGVSADFAAVPRAAVKALKITRGKPFRSGIVFIDGKYIKPPYRVERYGTALRINGRQVTDEIVPWEDFLKTQDGVQIVKTEIPAPVRPVAAPVPPPAPKVVDDPLADLFDDVPAPKAKKPAPAPTVRPPQPIVKTTVVFDGEFVPNERSAALLARVNAMRTEVDAHLRRGGFICFGSRYSRVTGDEGATRRILTRLPELMKESSTVRAFSDGVREAGFVFFPDALNEDLFNNRIHYLPLMEHRQRLNDEGQIDSLLKGHRPSF